MAGRVHKSLLNAKVNLVFYFLSLFFSFFSRKIFLDCLGDEFIGLTGTLGNILGYLNLAELGVGAAISFFLYKPLQANNREEINEIISVFGYLYHKIGQFILLGGILISLFFPLIFGNTELGLGIVYFSFFSFLGSSLIGYFINYRQILLTADQKNYLVAVYFQSANLVKTALQIFLAYTYKNLFVWVAIEFLFGIIGCIILNWKINKEYPWLKSNVRQGKVLLKKYPEVTPKIKQVFLHKIKDFILRQSDSIFIYAFVSLKMVAFYGNYTMLVNKLILLMNMALDGVTAGVGSLVAENNKDNTIKVFWELMTIRYFIAGFMCYSLFFLVEPFISLWLGHEYILSNRILILLLIYSYLLITNGVVYMYLHAYGLYQDVWAMWTELLLNVSLTIGLGWYIGLEGLLWAKLISVFLILVLWKPYFLFKEGLGMPISNYWNGTIRYIAAFIITLVIGYFLLFNYKEWALKTWSNLIGYGLLVLFSYLLLTVILYFSMTWGIKNLYKRLKIQLIGDKS